jgi:hypothetical protein
MTIYDPWKRDVLRVTLHEQEVQGLMALFPKLARTEIVDAIGRKGPMRSAVEVELTRLSSAKR